MDRMGWLSMRGEIFVVAIIEDHWYVLMYQLPSRAELTCSYAVQYNLRTCCRRRLAEIRHRFLGCLIFTFCGFLLQTDSRVPRMNAKATLPAGAVTGHCLRLQPGDALMPSLKEAASTILGRLPREQCGSAFVITAVGSLQDVTLRLANASRMDGDQNDGNDIKRYENTRFEIVSLTGTFSRDDGCHVHISLADAEGKTVGGHLIDGVIFTTCELVLGTAGGVEFVRKMDYETGYNELEVRQLLRSVDPTQSNFGLAAHAMMWMAFFWSNVFLWKFILSP